jgi:alkanesulfonate monooxygenase SsuD/methylene tetrahydromethanopterin reductase-like flavin-dependent oxidoreductase (luciferase family)
VEIAIGLPTTIPGATREQVLEWARRADAAAFSSLGTIDRLVYPNYEPFIALAAAAAVTERARLMTAIALLPQRANAALVAKQAASLHRLSGGRLVLGVAPGGRPDDLEAAGVPFNRRGKLMDQMLDEITRTWAGEERGFAGGIGPDVSDDPPSILVGGQADVAFRRAASYGDGWINGGGPPEAFAGGREKVGEAFRDAGRTEQPRAVSLTYFSLDDDPEEQTRRTIGDYYAFAGEYQAAVVQGTAKGEDEVKERVRRFAEAGCDELVMFPASPDPDQVDKLAAAVL